MVLMILNGGWLKPMGSVTGKKTYVFLKEWEGPDGVIVKKDFIGVHTSLDNYYIQDAKGNFFFHKQMSVAIPQSQMDRLQEAGYVKLIDK